MRKTRNQIMISGLMVAFILLAARANADSAGPERPAIPLFVRGQNGYHTYWIPALTVTPSGMVLAFAEARKNSGGDAGKIDVVVRRSTDNGKTWSEQQLVWADKD